MLPESLRTRLQEKLDMTVRQAYGTVFLGCIGFECEAMTGLHVPDSIWAEIVDPGTGRQVPPGSVGEIVAHELQPFLSHDPHGYGRSLLSQR